MDKNEQEDRKDSSEVQTGQPDDGSATATPPSGSVSTPRNVTGYFTLAALRSMSVDELRPHFKDIRGVWRTASLFEETSEDPAKYPPIYTLKDDDTSSCVSLKRLYLLIEDVTEYEFARVCLGSWDHWVAITESWVLKPHIEDWRSLLEKQLRAKYIQYIKEETEHGDGPNRLNAIKYLLEQTTEFGLGRSKRGRPSKAEKAEHLARESKSAGEIAKDAERLGLKVVK
jgi:hypothetical protein